MNLVAPRRDSPYIGNHPDFSLQVDLFTAGSIWQLAKGSVTNRKARTTELNVDGLDYVIQHSAIIDSGSSGGPLMLKDENGSYYVVGVNTWSARGRDNTYFSIPSLHLVEILDSIPKMLNPQSTLLDLEQALTDQVESFVAAYSSKDEDFISDRTFLSHDLIFANGWKSYSRFRKNLEIKERDDWDHYFFNGNTYEVMQESVYKDILKSVSSEDDNELKIDMIDFPSTIN